MMPRLIIAQAIARAVYCRKRMVIFDDVLSGLDSLTEELVFQRVIGPNGLLRKNGATVVLATHSSKGTSIVSIVAANILKSNGYLKLISYSS